CGDGASHGFSTETQLNQSWTRSRQQTMWAPPQLNSPDFSLATGS
ncbi:unnamed protein product, partial [Rotaria magnacalcarata]